MREHGRPFFARWPRQVFRPERTSLERRTADQLSTRPDDRNDVGERRDDWLRVLPRTLAERLLLRIVQSRSLADQGKGKRRHGDQNQDGARRQSPFEREFLVISQFDPSQGNQQIGGRNEGAQEMEGLTHE